MAAVTGRPASASMVIWSTMTPCGPWPASVPARTVTPAACARATVAGCASRAARIHSRVSVLNPIAAANSHAACEPPGISVGTQAMLRARMSAK